MSEIWLIQDLHAKHTGLTGAPDWSDRCPRVRTKKRSLDRFRLVKGFPFGARPPHPIKYKGTQPIEVSNRSNQSTFIFLLFPFALYFSNLLLVVPPSYLRLLRAF
jgi:hypothetical protein